MLKSTFFYIFFHISVTITYFAKDLMVPNPYPKDLIKREPRASSSDGNSGAVPATVSLQMATISQATVPTRRDGKAMERPGEPGDLPLNRKIQSFRAKSSE